MDLVPQIVEQLVEVPTIVSYSALQRSVEDRVNIPVPGRGGRITGPQGFLPRQSSTALHGSQERISERIRERLLEQMLGCIPGEGPQGFLLGQCSSSSSHRPAGISEDTDEPVDGVLTKIYRRSEHYLGINRQSTGTAK